MTKEGPEPLLLRQFTQKVHRGISFVIDHLISKTKALMQNSQAHFSRALCGHATPIQPRVETTRLVQRLARAMLCAPPPTRAEGLDCSSSHNRDPETGGRWPAGCPFPLSLKEEQTEPSIGDPRTSLAHQTGPSLLPVNGILVGHVLSWCRGAELSEHQLWFGWLCLDSRGRWPPQYDVQAKTSEAQQTSLCEVKTSSENMAIL